MSPARRGAESRAARSTRADGAAAGEATARVPAPLVLDRYALQQRLGTGAFGTVWMARDERLERDVAVKILARELVSGGRFEREARAAARLSHPGIVTLYEAAVDDEGAYLVSELVRGDTLGTLLQEGRLSDRDVLEIGVGLCDALAHAHAQGVVHRDVKPSNVLVPSSGRSTRSPCKLTDFGVARVIDSDSLTLTGDVIGTLNYMAPEQAAGLEAGEPADLYSLALVLYEALSGVNPLRSSGWSGSASRRARPGIQLPSLRRQRRELPGPLAAAIDRALRPRVDERGTLGELRDGLAGALEHVGQAPGVVTGAFDRGPRSDDAPDGPTALFAPRPGGSGAPAPGAAVEPLPTRADGVAAADPSRLIWQARGLAGAAAAAAAAWLDHTLLAPHGALTLPTALVALLAGGLTVLLPRLGWLALTAYVCVVAAIQGAAGAATVAAAAALLPIVLLPATATLWPLAAAAPALGLIGLAGGWPALAGWARSPWRRMMLGATGWLWLALAGPLAGRRLYEPRPHAALALAAWRGSPARAVTHVLTPLVHSGELAGALVWAVAAILVPWVVRSPFGAGARRRPLIGVGAAILWAAALALTTPLALSAARGAGRTPAGARGAVAGAVVAALLALAPLAVREIRRTGRGSSPGMRVS
jgi:tRNA A-37 threonylcarbamoyl transferase component Bud32